VDGRLVGALLVGFRVGEMVGFRDGLFVGAFEGDWLGVSVGGVGAVGEELGAGVGLDDTKTRQKHSSRALTLQLGRVALYQGVDPPDVVDAQLPA